ncbi:glycosyltransferase family 4 protein [Rhodanobacter sp. 115]|uniref:glycosyltransferase family 4 protein n=1 Tax=Rhodanobacter sp. FW021-MT20 TaxID=1162282 RepID=UPI001ED95BBA|nr:glycosyltransferase family 4 protein [Rhodanobacter sp. 115]
MFANTDWYLYNFRRSLALELQARGYDVLLISPPGNFGAKLMALGLSWKPLTMRRRSLNPLNEFRFLLQLIRLIRREKPALVHGFTIKGAIYGSIASRIAGVRARIMSIDGLGYVFTSNDKVAGILRPVVRMLLRQSLRGGRAKVILLNSDDVSQFLEDRLARLDQIRLIRGVGVDLNLFSRSSTASTGTPSRVLLAARLLWDKGVGEYIQACRYLLAQGREIRFLLAGSSDLGNPAAIPEDVIRAWVNEGIVEWLGHVSDMRALLGSVDLVVLPSYREGLPTILVEAAACGLPLIATDVPGCREVVTDGADGLLVPVRDARALACAIARLTDDRPLAARLGAAARRKVELFFDERIVTQLTLGVYEELLIDVPRR